MPIRLEVAVACVGHDELVNAFAEEPRRHTKRLKSQHQHDAENPEGTNDG